MTHDVVTSLLLSIGILLACARILSEIARRFHQPAVLGEICAGLLLGPTILGHVAPHWVEYLFPRSGPGSVAFQSLTTVAVVMYLLVAGMEIELSAVWRQGFRVLKIGAAGVFFPMIVGMASGWLAPNLFGADKPVETLVFCLFLANALAISALPVIAKTLMDLNLYRSDFGMIIVTSAVFDDVCGWFLFAIVLSMMGTAGSAGTSVGVTIALTVLFAGLMLTVGRWLIHRSLPWIQAHTHWPAGVLALSMALAMFGAAFTHWIGIHALFGSFMVGVAVGDSSHLRERTRAIIDEFVSFIFAPLFFASIGLRVDFIEHFDPIVVTSVLVIACVGKVVGCGLGALWSGMPKREAWAVGFGMNARGAMEIILGVLALEHGLIGERLFVALVVMALVTSMASGPMVQWLLGRQRARWFTDYLSNKCFLPVLKGENKREVIEELSRTVAQAHALSFSVIDDAVWTREKIMSTGVGHWVALPHARIPGLASPLVALGISPVGIDFDTPDGELVHFVFLILAPPVDNGAQLEILADIGKIFKDHSIRDRALKVGNYTELLALFKIERLKHKGDQS
ncbi:MAG: cation:proton antiporter [Planctomycetota bacterium]